MQLQHPESLLQYLMVPLLIPFKFFLFFFGGETNISLLNHRCVSSLITLHVNIWSHPRKSMSTSVQPAFVISVLWISGLCAVFAYQVSALFLFSKVIQKDTIEAFGASSIP